MALPKQITPEKLQVRLDEAERQLNNNEVPDAPLSVHAVRGGRAEQQGRGAALVQPTSERVAELPFVARTVEIQYDSYLPSGPVTMRTSPARLVKIGGEWNQSGLEGPWRTDHTIENTEGVGSLIYQVPQDEMLAAMPPTPVVDSGPEVYARYDIPPAATKIRGHGRVQYMTGHTLEVEGDSLLKRPMADGELGIRQGGVYATFESFHSTAQDTPKALIGTRWTTMTPTDEKE